MHETEQKQKRLIRLHLRARESKFYCNHQTFYLNKLHLISNIQQILQQLQERNDRYTRELTPSAENRHDQTISAVSQMILSDSDLRLLIEDGDGPDAQSISFTVKEGCDFFGDGLMERMPSLTLVCLSGWKNPVTLFGSLVADLSQRLSRATLISPTFWLRFMQRKYECTVLFKYEDRSLKEVDFPAIISIGDPLESFTEKKNLWGALAGFSELYHDMILSISRVDRMPERINPHV